MQRPEAEHEAEGGKGVFDPAAAEPAQVEHEEESGSRRERERRDDKRSHEEWIARNVEASAEPEERHEHEQAQQSLLEVEAFHQMHKTQSDHKHDRELPRPAAPARERA